MKVIVIVIGIPKWELIRKEEGGRKEKQNMEQEMKRQRMPLNSTFRYHHFVTTYPRKTKMKISITPIDGRFVQFQ